MQWQSCLLVSIVYCGIPDGMQTGNDCGAVSYVPDYRDDVVKTVSSQMTVMQHGMEVHVFMFLLDGDERCT